MYLKILFRYFIYYKIYTRNNIIYFINLLFQTQLSVAAVISHQDASLQEDIQAWEEKRKVSKHALSLQQLDNGVKILPRFVLLIVNNYKFIINNSYNYNNKYSPSSN